MKRLLLYTLCLAALALPAWAANSETDFGGVGLDGVPLKNGQIVIRQIINGGPAHQAGIRSGDIITHIDGKATQGSNFPSMVQKRLRGLSGTALVLRIKRDGEGQPQTYRLIRRQIVIIPNKEKL
ncbi:MAG: PDZ domain-containing protein [Steroidobacteraceae bacterium]|nr:PDZ domain-containing protein [Deltaproteobacteria bacterium]